jgi:hypothetical protein
MVTKLAPAEIAQLEPYKFMATIGERVIPPGGRASTEALLERARSNVRAARVDGRVTVDDGDILAFLSRQRLRRRHRRGRDDVRRTRAGHIGTRSSDQARRTGARHRVLLARAPTPKAREMFLGQVCPGLQFETESDRVRIYRGTGLDDLHTETGPFEILTPRGLLADDGFLHSLAILRHVACRPANVRKMTRLKPRMASAFPYLGYIFVAAGQPT